MTKEMFKRPEWNPEDWKDKILFFIIHKLGCSKEEAEDICQDVLLAILENLKKERTKDIKNPSSYIYKIALNKINDKLRERYRGNKVSLNIELPDSSMNPLEKLIHGDLVNKGLKILNHKERRILYLYCILGWTYEEIAQFLGMKNEAVRKATERAFKKIRKKIKE